MSDSYKKSKSFLGTGWGFPPTFHDHPLMGVEMVSNEHDIKESLEILLNTNLGERTMLPEYGSELQYFLFQPITNSRMHYLRDIIKTAILKYEPRIRLNDIQIDQKDYLDGVIRVAIKYTIKSNNTRFNLVFPYYKQEGTDIPQLYHKHVSQTAMN
ncbi:MAG: GPW/gp25 family protein [Bacteroidota bacterium]